MATYYSIPAEGQEALEDVRKAASVRDTTEYKELLLLYLGARRDLLKLVIDRDIGRDYSDHTVLYRGRFDPAKPETWETQVSQVLNRVSSLSSSEPNLAPSGNITPATGQEVRKQRAVGVLFDIDGLGGPSSYGTPCWRILMKHVDLKQMPGVLFYQGDVDVQASQRPYCYCIAISELPALTGGRGSEYFVRTLTGVSDAGLFPVGQRFIQGDITRSLIGSGRVDIEGRFRMSSNLGDLGDLRLVTSGREFGWTVLPDDDLLAVFALTYLGKIGGQGIPLGDESRETCEAVLRQVGQRSVLAALRGADIPPDRLKAATERIVQQVWKGAPEQHSSAATSAAKLSSTDRQPKKWWEFWR